MLRYTAYDLNNSLSVAAKIYDVTLGSPVFVATVDMASLGLNGTYFLSYQAPAGKLYVVNMMPYNDPGTWESPDTTYTPGDAQLGASQSGGGGGDGSCPTAVNIFGLVNNPTTVVGFVNCDCD